MSKREEFSQLSENEKIDNSKDELQPNLFRTNPTEQQKEKIDPVSVIIGFLGITAVFIALEYCVSIPVLSILIIAKIIPKLAIINILPFMAILASIISVIINGLDIKYRLAGVYNSGTSIIERKKRIKQYKESKQNK